MEKRFLKHFSIEHFLLEIKQLSLVYLHIKVQFDLVFKKPLSVISYISPNIMFLSVPNYGRLNNPNLVQKHGY